MSTDAHKETLSAESIERLEWLRLEYGFGDCAIFAAALGRICSFPIVEFYEGNELFHVALVDDAKSKKGDSFIDVFGRVTLGEIRRRYGIFGRIRIEQKDERELHRMTLFDEADVIKALVEVQWMTGAGILSVQAPVEIGAKVVSRRMRM